MAIVFIQTHTMVSFNEYINQIINMFIDVHNHLGGLGCCIWPNICCICCICCICSISNGLFPGIMPGGCIIPGGCIPGIIGWFIPGICCGFCYLCIADCSINFPTSSGITYSFCISLIIASYISWNIFISSGLEVITCYPTFFMKSSSSYPYLS